jgi:hypothetical protein
VNLDFSYNYEWQVPEKVWKMTEKAYISGIIIFNLVTQCPQVGLHVYKHKKYIFKQGSGVGT